jgi:hypothetical protein
MKLKDLFEALSDIQTRDAFSQTHHGDIRNTTPEHDCLSPQWIKQRDRFLSHYPQAKAMFSSSKEKRPYQIRIPIDIHPDMDDIIEQDEVFKIIDSTPTVVQFKISDYLKGIVNTEITTGGTNGIPFQTKIRPIKIVDFLKNNGLADYVKKYINSPYRAATKQSAYDMIITGHPIDVYGMSTGRGWTSCATMTGKFDEPSTKSYKFSVDNDIDTNAGLKIGNEINSHTHVVYLVPRGGDVDHDAMARVAFKNFTNITTDKPHLVADSMYGASIKEFYTKAKEIMEELFPLEDGIYDLSKGSYVDIDDIFVNGNPDLNKDAISKLEKLWINTPEKVNQLFDKSKISFSLIIQMYYHCKPDHPSKLYSEDLEEYLDIISEFLGVGQPPEEPANIFCAGIYSDFSIMELWRTSTENQELCKEFIETIAASPDYSIFDSPHLFSVISDIKKKRISTPEELDIDIFVSFLFHELLMLDVLPTNIPSAEDGMMSIVLGLDECLDNKSFSPSVVKKFSSSCNALLGTSFSKPLDGWVQFYVDNGNEDLGSEFGLHDAEDWMNYAASKLYDFISLDYHNKPSTTDKEWEEKLKEKVSPKYYEMIKDQITYNG